MVKKEGMNHDESEESDADTQNANALTHETTAPLVSTERETENTAHAGNAHESGSERDPERRYQENLETLKKVEEADGMTAYAKERVTEESFYGNEDLTVYCSDERTEGFGPRDLGGPLFALFILKVDRKQLAAAYWAQGVRTLTSHHECGAAKAAYKAAHPGSDPTWDEVNEFAKRETEMFAREFAEYQFGYEHIDAAHMATDGHFHPGVCIYLDDVGGFSWRQTDGMPQGYKVSSTVSKDPVAGVVALLDLVAFAQGNAGTRMQKDGISFPIYIVAATREAFDARCAELRTAIQGKPYEASIVFEMIEKPESVPVREHAKDLLK
ncbi:hypothetical protein KGO06_01805 [Patescibacteria group bacterium]|nr:hypothetical protein [Patescibacteria group bacterium]